MNTQAPTAAADRPARAIENCIQRLNSVNQMADNIEHRLRNCTQRLVHGDQDQPKLSAVNREAEVRNTGPELSELTNQVDTVEHRLQLILDHVNTLETI